MGEHDAVMEPALLELHSEPVSHLGQLREGIEAEPDDS